jgi:glutamate receptor-interacting protein
MFNRRSTESQIRLPNFEEPHYSIVPAPGYWNTMKPTRNENQDELMGNSVSQHDLVNYNNVDLNVAQQKLMSLSLGPKANISHSTQTEFSQQNNNAMMSVNVINVVLKPNGGPLGITLAGNEDGQKAIVISAVIDGGIAAQSGQIVVGDILMAINNESVIGLPLSNAKKLLQAQSETVELKLSRPNTTSLLSVIDKIPHPQPLYAEVQRRPNNLVKVEVASNSSSRSESSDGQLQTIHVALYKDQVYDDYGFSVSDGLYERGVYINRVRSGGPADKTGQLRPYDRIIQVRVELYICLDIFVRFNLNKL